MLAEPARSASGLTPLLLLSPFPRRLPVPLPPVSLLALSMSSLAHWTQGADKYNSSVKVWKSPSGKVRAALHKERPGHLQSPPFVTHPLASLESIAEQPPRVGTTALANA